MKHNKEMFGPNDPDLDVEYPQVGDQVPAGRAITVIAVKTKAGSIVDGISCLVRVSGEI